MTRTARIIREGSCCRFVQRPGHRWGLKLYKDSMLRDRCFALQSLAASHGLAPACRLPFNGTKPSRGLLRFGFLTEVIEPLDRVALNLPPRAVHHLPHVELWAALRSIGIWPGDCGYHSTYFKPDGSVAVFDFSHCKPL